MLERLKLAALAVYKHEGVRKALYGAALLAAGVFAESMGLSQFLAGLAQ